MGGILHKSHLRYQIPNSLPETSSNFHGNLDFSGGVGVTAIVAADWVCQRVLAGSDMCVESVCHVSMTYMLLFRGPFSFSRFPPTPPTRLRSPPTVRYTVHSYTARTRLDAALTLLGHAYDQSAVCLCWTSTMGATPGACFIYLNGDIGRAINVHTSPVIITISPQALPQPWHRVFHTPGVNLVSLAEKEVQAWAKAWNVGGWTRWAAVAFHRPKALFSSLSEHDGEYKCTSVHMWRCRTVLGINKHQPPFIPILLE